MGYPTLGAGATVSIVIPAYNHGAFVEEAIQSVLAQDYPAIELIVIDDGSTDETAAVLERFRERASVVRQTNAGQAATINRGWADARGDVLSYLSADDRLEPGAISRAVAALNAHPDAVMVYGDYDLIDPESAVVRRVAVPEFDYATMVRDLLCAPGPGVFIRRQAAERAGGWDVSLRQAPDFEYWLRLALLGPFRRVPHVLAALRVHPGSTSYAAAPPDRADEPIRIMESYFRRTDLPSAARGLERHSLASAHLLAARAHLRARRFGSASRSLVRASALSPSATVSPRAARLLMNALVNRTGHRLLWFVRRAKARGNRPSA